LPKALDLTLTSCRRRSQAPSFCGCPAQDFSDYRVLIRDDCSSDSTIEILDEYAARDPRFFRIDSTSENLGAQASFVNLLNHVDANYFMFCDQDDVWCPDKVRITVENLGVHDDHPHLVFTDLQVVDGDLNVVSPSFMRYQRFDPKIGVNFSRLLAQNVVVGCTLGGNRRLLDVSRLADGIGVHGMMMHDWWLALVASAFGTITFVPQATIYYRQHGGNVLGAAGSSFGRYVRMLRSEKPWVKAQKYFSKVSCQAESFHALYASKLDPEQSKAVLSVMNLDRGVVQIDLIKMFLQGIQMNGLDRNLALFLSHIAGRNPGIWKAAGRQSRFG
jgi:glycosyltransferase involved in cell wall biosynthesis